ncbi:putative membrane protein YesL [Peribacillus deserti]|uniref:Membrane protein YesL n=1 Tax=Peribacillus deserti TaxID=673318 RepID=A0ABS2QFX8_9BACI|nr:hypothetical protein [Peribacillus deserti]MBM7692061.1 putative membrane protein YesL [Peribacillus deserti]
MNKSRFIESRFHAFTDITYGLVKASLLFWEYLIRNFIVFGIAKSFCTLLETVNELFAGSGKPVRELFRENSTKYSYKKLSLVAFLLIIYISAFIILPFPESFSSYYASIIKFGCLYIFLLGLVLFSYISWNLISKDVTVKQAVMYGFYLMVKRFFRSILLIIIILAIMYVADINFIFFLFFAPGIFAMCVRFILRKI